MLVTSPASIVPFLNINKQDDNKFLVKYLNSNSTEIENLISKSIITKDGILEAGELIAKNKELFEKDNNISKGIEKIVLKIAPSKA
ncbi:MAG: hypothetical protein MR902_08955 [Campylobacter sp.]|nr:hypothetical protein [Campylobacter sp.]